MPQKIITLSKELANQIAAGEVVERPVSVVKELVENSIDAGALSIRVRLQNGGIDMIEVSDDGAGIGEDDLVKAIEKYSTSKISSLKDLQEVMTFGFRGEALASISSVSQFTLSSNTSESGAGKSISYRDGELSHVADIALERGTSIRVESLFYNTPARLNYLKTPRTEYLKIQEFIQKMALVYPEREFSLEHEGKQTLSFSKDQDLKARIYEIYGEEFSENLLKLEHEFNGIHISGVVSDPKVSFVNRTKQVLFVNKRIITSPMIIKAISDAYNRYIAPKTFPGYVIFIDIDPTQVDVNVHPRKMEVRFASEQNLFRSTYHGVQDILEEVSLVSSSDSQLSGQNYSPVSLGKNNDTPTKYHTSSGTKFKNYSPYTDTSVNPAQGAIDFSKNILGDTQAGSNASEKLGDLRDTPLGKIVGQMHNAYIVVETVSGIQILDQHALAERVIYEQLAHNSYIPKSQQILGGISVKLTSPEQEILEEFTEIFLGMGFDIEILSHGIISLQAIPDFASKQNIEKTLRLILSDIGVEGSKSLQEIRHKIWAFTACRSAIKFGDPLSIFEMNALLRDASLDYSATCPHGRPVVYEIGLGDLQKKYDR